MTELELLTKIYLAIHIIEFIVILHFFLTWMRIINNKIKKGFNVND